MDDQEQTVRDLIQRNVGPRASDFSVSVSHEIAVLGKDTFKVCVLFFIRYYCIILT